MPKATVRRKRVNLGVLVLHVPYGWEVKPLTPAERKARQKQKDDRAKERREAQAKRWEVARVTRKPEPAKSQPAATAQPSVWHQPARRTTAGGPGQPTVEQLRASGLCGARTKDGSACLNSKNCPIPAHKRDRRW